MRRTQMAVTVLVLAALAACGTHDDAAEWDGFDADTPPATSTPPRSEEPDDRLDRFDVPEGECGVTLVCGLGAGPDGPMTP